MGQRDMMLVMSDQHSYMVTGFADDRVDTPQLERIAGDGMLFDHCYCTAPLCVPSRMSFLSRRMPSELGIFNNDSTLSSDVPTIAHELGAMGYRTVLIGRMHFKGDEQKHGFDERLCGDITSQYWGTGGKRRTDFEGYAGTGNRLHCLEAVGGGISPVMYFDRLVFDQAKEFLETLKVSGEDRPPLFLVVGFYGPHFPYVCSDGSYRKYRERFFVEECERAQQEPALSIYRELQQENTAEHIRNCRAAYCGLVEEIDGYTGALYDSFLQAVRDRDYLFCYTSDHGEQLGYRKLYGKQTLYEEAVRVPLLLTGTGIGKGVYHSAVSLLDLAEMLTEAETGKAGPCSFPEGEHWARFQHMLTHEDRKILAEGASNGRSKVLRAEGIWYVYDLVADPDEKENLLETRQKEAEDIILLAVQKGCFVEPERLPWLIEKETELCRRQKQLTLWGSKKCPDEWATVKIPPGALKEPEE